MNRLLATPRRVFAIGALAAVVVVVAAGFGYAAVAADNQTYTGCLQNGDMTNIAIGSTPFKACPKNATQISWSQTGPPGLDGQDGAPGEAVAYARISAVGDVVPQFSSNVVQANVTHPAPGLYCIGGLSFTPKSVVATGVSGIDASGTPTFVDTVITVTVSEPGITFPLGCAVTDQVRIRTIAATQGTALVDRGFNLWFED